MNAVLKKIKTPVLVAFAVLFLCGLGYPLLLTGISQAIFPDRANGSLVEINGRAVGSKLVGQDFTDARFMKCRPSAVSYNTYTQEDKRNGSYAGLASGSQNLGPANPALVKRVEADIAEFLKDYLKRLCLVARRHPTFRERIGMQQTPTRRRTFKAIKFDDIG